MKQRLDQLLVERRLFPSREKAKAAILAGHVLINDRKAEKAGTMLEPDQTAVRITAALPYVSRGGLKLEKALSGSGIDLQGRICLDIGASTGGFTDCMLQNGAARVYSVDAGTGQLAPALRDDSRVTVMEKTNFRYLTPADFADRPDFAAADVSFISLDKILPPAYAVLSAQGEMICLIKPQFEAGRGRVGKRGVVKDQAVHVEVIEKIIQSSGECGFSACHLDYSPVRGPEGNIEYLLHLAKECFPQVIDGEEPRRVVAAAHKCLTVRQ